MELTPEERKRIYDEERTRLEAQGQPQQERAEAEKAIEDERSRKQNQQTTRCCGGCLLLVLAPIVFIWITSTVSENRRQSDMAKIQAQVEAETKAEAARNAALRRAGHRMHVSPSTRVVPKGTSPRIKPFGVADLNGRWTELYAPGTGGPAGSPTGHVYRLSVHGASGTIYRNDCTGGFGAKVETVKAGESYNIIWWTRDGSPMTYEMTVLSRNDIDVRSGLFISEWIRQ